jgi:signal transduction histidine kinase
VRRPDVDVRSGRVVAGIVFALVGIGFLLESVGAWRVDLVYVWPVLLIAVGVSFLLGRAKRIRIEEDRSAKLAVAEERVRIARELHDIVAHGVSLMTIQIAAARRVAARQPEAADQALAAAEEAGRQSLAELRSLLAVLRSADASLGEMRFGAPSSAWSSPPDGTTTADADADAAYGPTGTAARRRTTGPTARHRRTTGSTADRPSRTTATGPDTGRGPDDAAPTTPLPRLADVPDLVEALRSAGLDVRLEQDGLVPVMSPAAELTVYRVVQESLTNVVRHGPGARVRVALAYDVGGVGVLVEDNGAGVMVPAPAGDGHGLTGMRERVAAAGGRLRAAPRTDAPGWRVDAYVPATSAGR